MDSGPFGPAVWLAGALVGGSLGQVALAAQDATTDAGGQQHYECVVEPRVVVDVGSSAAGVIETLDVERGQAVSAGEVVAELEARVERAALAVARARAGIDTDVAARQVALDFQRRARTRIDELFRQQTVAESSMDEAERDVLISELALRKAREERELAALELERARQILDRRTIRSPVSGVVMERFVNAGEYVEDQPVMRVAALDPLRVQVVLPAEHYGVVGVGAVADVMPEIAGLGLKEAVVTSVDRVLDAASGTFRVELDLPNPDDALPAGMRCRLSFADRAPSRETVAALARARDASSRARRSAGEQPTDSASQVSSARDAASRNAALRNAAILGHATGGETDRTEPARRKIVPNPTDQGAAVRSATAGRDAAQDRPVEARGRTPAEEITAASPAAAVQPSGLSTVAHTARDSVCRRVGPFASETEAGAFVRELGAVSGSASTLATAGTEVIGYTVLAGRARQRGTPEALVAELRARGIEDLALIKRGPLAGRVSLGYFSQAEFAERRVGELARLGIETALATRERTVERYWVEIEARRGPPAAALPRLASGVRVGTCPDMLASRG